MRWDMFLGKHHQIINKIIRIQDLFVYRLCFFLSKHWLLTSHRWIELKYCILSFDNTKVHSHQTGYLQPRSIFIENECWKVAVMSHIRCVSHMWMRSDASFLTFSTWPQHSSAHYCALQYIINLVWSTLTWLTTMIMCTLRGIPALLTSCSRNVFLLTVNWTPFKFAGMCGKWIF